MLKAIKMDTLKIGKLELTVAILEDGQRVIEAESLHKFLDRMKEGNDLIAEEVDRLARFIKGI